MVEVDLTITALATGLFFLFSVGTVIYTIHLSRLNNYRYNEKIVKLLEEISKKLGDKKHAY